MKVTVSNSDIVNGCLKGNKEAFRQLYHKHHPWMMGVCMRYCRDRDEAKDVLQECLIRVFNAIGSFTFQGDAQFVSWLKRIVVNTSLSYLRQQSKENFIPLDDGAPLYMAAEEPADYSVAECLPQEKLLGMISEMPAGYRAVFNMYVFEEMSHREIAQELGISENTSKTQLLKARCFLKNKITNTVKTFTI
jgi:RNA polymerase sigma-70 factor (ECF subfamily)